MPSQPDPYAPHRAVPGKPITQSFPTPNLKDRILIVHKDSRKGGYTLPAKGDVFKGPEAAKFKDYKFATAKPSDQTGWVDWFFLNERANQDEYNYAIDYPYADKDYPRYTRTYVLLREDVEEPEADDEDPVFNDPDANDGLILKLTEHRQVRLEDPVLDALFVGVQRSYERLPSPVITSYEQNGEKQIVTIATQEVETADVPTSSATTEVLKVERSTTAKAKVTTGTVPEVFPADSHSVEIPDLLPPEMRGLVPTITEALDLEGDAVLPTLGVGELAKSESQKDEFVKRASTTKRAPVLLPKTLTDKDLGGLSQGRFGEGFTNERDIVKTVDAGVQNLDSGILVTDSEVHNLGDGNSYKITKEVDDWPVLRERIVDEKEGIAVLVEKRVIEPLDDNFLPVPGGYTDVRSYDKWRSIQITSRVDLSTLPPPIEYAMTHNYSFPDVLEEVRGEWTPDLEYVSSHEDLVENVRRSNQANVAVLSSPSGKIVAKIRSGFNGPMKARVVRTFLPIAPTLGSIPTPTVIRPVTGMAFIRAVTVRATGGTGAGLLSSSYHQSNSFEQHIIANVLTGSYITANLNYATPPVNVTASSVGYDDAGVNPATPYSISRLVSSTGILVVDIPLSTPGSLNSGQEILIAAPLERWRFGLYVQELIYVRVP